LPPQRAGAPQKVSETFARRGPAKHAFWIPIRGVTRRFMAITQSFGDQALAGFSSAKCLNEDNYFFQKLS
jgi:predicted molibdopterin-dependent oxidoreductase YjgC